MRSRRHENPRLNAFKGYHATAPGERVLARAMNQQMKMDQNLKDKAGADIYPMELASVQMHAAPLRQNIVSALRRAIELGTLMPGEHLIEKDLCAKLNVSRTSLREALRDLEANGVLTSRSARGLVITPVSAADIVIMWRVRRSIELLLVEDFIECAGEAELAQLATALQQMRDAAQSSIGTMDAQRDYYEAWCRGARNPYAFGVLMNIQLRVSVVRRAISNQQEFRIQNIQGKEAIFDCMAQKNLPAAQNAVRAHIENATKAALLYAQDFFADHADSSVGLYGSDLYTQRPI